MLGPREGQEHPEGAKEKELLARGRHRQLCDLSTQACGGARNRGTSKRRRGSAQSPSPLEDVGGGNGLSKTPRNTQDPLWDCTWIGLRNHQNLVKELHWSQWGTGYDPKLSTPVTPPSPIFRLSFPNTIQPNIQVILPGDKGSSRLRV